MTLRTLNYGNYGIFLIVGNAGFCPSTVLLLFLVLLLVNFFLSVVVFQIIIIIVSLTIS